VTEDIMADNVKPMSDRAKDAMAEAVDKTKHVVDDGLDHARDKFEDVVDELDGRYRKAASGVKRSAERVGEVAREKYQVAAEGVREGYVKVRKDLDRLGGDVSEYVRENPGKSLLMAAGVGFVIGLLLRRPGSDEA
jgi:ElaB/YqjD/DUF883 family membrane-anchored ribosome-binding protein